MREPVQDNSLRATDRQRKGSDRFLAGSDARDGGKRCRRVLAADCRRIYRHRHLSRPPVHQSGPAGANRETENDGETRRSTGIIVGRDVRFRRNGDDGRTRAATRREILFQYAHVGETRPALANAFQFEYADRVTIAGACRGRACPALFDLNPEEDSSLRSDGGGERPPYKKLLANTRFDADYALW